MKNKNMIRDVLLLATPFLLFFALLVPYCWVNKAFIVEWFGCGCPKVDEFGMTVYPDFNANDFTRLFWLFISLCATVISAFLSKRILKKRRWLRVLYVAGMFVLSLLIAWRFSRMMMWR